MAGGAGKPCSAALSRSSPRSAVEACRALEGSATSEFFEPFLDVAPAAATPLPFVLDSLFREKDFIRLFRNQEDRRFPFPFSFAGGRRGASSSALSTEDRRRCISFNSSPVIGCELSAALRERSLPPVTSTSSALSVPSAASAVPAPAPAPVAGTVLVSFWGCSLAASVARPPRDPRPVRRRPRNQLFNFDSDLRGCASSGAALGTTSPFSPSAVWDRNISGKSSPDAVVSTGASGSASAAPAPAPAPVPTPVPAPIAPVVSAFSAGGSWARPLFDLLLLGSFFRDSSRVRSILSSHKKDNLPLIRFSSVFSSASL